MEEMRQSSSSIFILVKSTDKCTNKCTDKCSEKRSGSIYVFLTAMWSSTQNGPYAPTITAHPIARFLGFSNPYAKIPIIKVYAARGTRKIYEIQLIISESVEYGIRVWAWA